MYARFRSFRDSFWTVRYLVAAAESPVCGEKVGALVWTGFLISRCLLQAAEPLPTRDQSSIWGQPVVLYDRANANPLEALGSRSLAVEWAEKTRRTIVPTMHLVETEHFLIFTAWNRSNDAVLGNLCERMFALLSQQFSVPATESVWIGKCPLFLFWEPAHYERFITEVDGSFALDSNMAHANGYHASRGRFAYIVINGVSTFGLTLEEKKAEFFHVLVHEGTHGFLDHYVSDASLPLWLEEGLADFIAASLVPASEANQKYKTASQLALRDPQMIMRLLDKKKHLTSTDYGLAHSLVRWLVIKDRMAMVRWLRLLKQGEKEEKSFKATYGMTRAQFLQAWARTWQP